MGDNRRTRRQEMRNSGGVSGVGSGIKPTDGSSAIDDKSTAMVIQHPENSTDAPKIVENESSGSKPAEDRPKLKPWQKIVGSVVLGAGLGTVGGGVLGGLTEPEALYNRQVPDNLVVDTNGKITSSTTQTEEKPLTEEQKKKLEADRNKRDEKRKEYYKAQGQEVDRKLKIIGAGAVAGGGIGLAVNRYLEGRQRERDEAEKGGKGA